VEKYIVLGRKTQNLWFIFPSFWNSFQTKVRSMIILFCPQKNVSVLCSWPVPLLWK